MLVTEFIHSTRHSPYRRWSLILFAFLFALQLALLATHPYEHELQKNSQDCEICVTLAHLNATKASSSSFVLPVMLATVILQALYFYFPLSNFRVSTRAPPVSPSKH
ncbi:MAG: hypothetical protein AMS22_08035 [Thiotrichales bacterium SG8_50]|jgi:hypothetical protein|nr:MAG: hypothetical protein AMS22_08035 [Thiotrichales bacterium SG8_50]